MFRKVYRLAHLAQDSADHTANIALKRRAGEQAGCHGTQQIGHTHTGHGKGTGDGLAHHIILFLGVGGEELLDVTAAVIVSDEDGHHDAAEDEYHVHIGIIGNAVNDI